MLHSAMKAGNAGFVNLNQIQLIFFFKRRYTGNVLNKLCE